MTSNEEIWKEEFLSEITEKFGFERVIKAENSNYRLIGLPFFNINNNQNFKSKFGSII